MAAAPPRLLSWISSGSLPVARALAGSAIKGRLTVRMAAVGLRSGVRVTMVTAASVASRLANQVHRQGRWGSEMAVALSRLHSSLNLKPPRTGPLLSPAKVDCQSAA